MSSSIFSRPRTRERSYGWASTGWRGGLSWPFSRSCTKASRRSSLRFVVASTTPPSYGFPLYWVEKPRLKRPRSLEDLTLQIVRCVNYSQDWEWCLTLPSWSSLNFAPKLLRAILVPLPFLYFICSLFVNFLLCGAISLCLVDVFVQTWPLTQIRKRSLLSYSPSGGPLLLTRELQTCWIKCVQALKNPNPFKDDGRLDVLVVAKLSLDRIWGTFYVLNPLLIESKA